MAAARRRSLSDLIKFDGDQEQEQPAAAVPEPPTAVAPNPGVRKSRAPQVREHVARWQTLERRDVLLRPDQTAALTDLRKRVARERVDRSERITDNTLIRLAVDLLLTRHGEALPGSGDTEEQLRAYLLDTGPGAPPA